MTMRLHDTARREVVPFEPGPVVRMYVCGITPYDATHLGHANTYLTYDLLVRRLEDLGHEVVVREQLVDAPEHETARIDRATCVRNGRAERGRVEVRVHVEHALRC